MSDQTNPAPRRRRTYKRKRPERSNPRSGRWFATPEGRERLKGNRFNVKYPDEQIEDCWRVGADLTLCHAAVAKIVGLPTRIARRVRLLQYRPAVVRAAFGEGVMPQHPYSAWSPDEAYRVPHYRKAMGIELDASQRRLRLKQYAIVQTPQRVVVDSPSRPRAPVITVPAPGSVTGTDGRTYTRDEVERLRERVNPAVFARLFPHHR